MNIIEACESLAAGRCRQIKRSGWERDALIIDAAGLLSFSFGNAFLPMPVDFTANDYVLVGEKPVMETVEVKRWMHIHKNGCIATEKPMHNPTDWIELTGTYQREIEPKWKRREEIILHKGSTWSYLGQTCGTAKPASPKHFIEWEE